MSILLLLQREYADSLLSDSAEGAPDELAVKIYYRNRWKALMTDGMTRQDVRQCRDLPQDHPALVVQQGFMGRPRNGRNP